MAEVKRIGCLANSRKTSGRCVAGKEWTGANPGTWIRPVSNRPTQEVSLQERRYEDGTDPKLLDIIDVPLLKPDPGSFQVENWVLDPQYYWARVGRLSLSDVLRFTDSPASLWLNGYSTNAGLNDRVPEDEAKRLQGSLYLLMLNSATLSVFAPGADFGNPRRRVQLRFTHRVVEYRLRVTDPIIEGLYLKKPDGDHAIEECFVTVSLGEAYEGYCYKLVAAVILPK